MDECPQPQDRVRAWRRFHPLLPGRFDWMYRRGTTKHIKIGLLARYLRAFHYESVVFDPDVLERLSEKVKPSHIMLGTDYPFGEWKPVELDPERAANSRSGARSASSAPTRRDFWDSVFRSHGLLRGGAGAQRRQPELMRMFIRRSCGRRRPHNGGRHCKARLPAAAVRIPRDKGTHRPVPRRAAVRHRPRTAALGTRVRVHRLAHKLRRAHRIPDRRLPARRPAPADRSRARRLARARRPDQAPHTALGRSVSVARPHIDLRRSDVDAARRNVDRSRR